MEEVAQNTAVDQAAPATEAKAEKKPRKMKKLKREDFVINAVKGGQRDALVIATALAEAAAKGEVSMKKNHKVAPTPLMWFLQVKWYFHQAKKKGLIDGDLIVPAREKKPRKKKEAAPAAEQSADPASATETNTAPAADQPAASSDAPVGTL